MKRNITKVSKEVSAAAFFAFTLFFIAPLTINKLNTARLGITIGSSWYLYLGLTLAVFILIFTVSLLVRKWYKFFPVILLALSICFWAQGTFLVTDIGQLDGRVINWTHYQTAFWIDIGFWIIGLAAFIYFRKTIHKNIYFIISLLLLVQLIPLFIPADQAAVLVNQPGSSQTDSPSLYFDPDQEFTFSSQKNVVIIVLDTFNSEVMSEIIATDPQIAQQFKDFTFYSDAAAGFPTTYPSIPLILSGQYYDNSQPIANFLKSVENQSLPYFLKQQGFEVQEYSFAPYAFNGVWSNRTTTQPVSDQINTIWKNYLVTYIRYLPVAVKPFFVNQYYQGSQSFYHQNVVDFFHNASRTKIEENRPVFKFIHLTGAHPPFLLDENLNRVESGEYIQQAKAALKAVNQLLIYLSKTAVYDKSMIFVIGDHGTHFPSTNNASTRPIYLADTAFFNDTLYLSSRPLLLIKNFAQQTDHITVNSMPSSLSDIPKTVADGLRLDNNFNGYSLFGIIPQDRVRKFNFYHWNNADWMGEYLPSVYPYEIIGSMENKANWKFTNQILTSTGKKDVKLLDYQYGHNIIQDVLQKDYGPTLTKGFDIFEDNKSEWAKGPLACVTLPVTPTKSLLNLRIKGYAYTGSGNDIKQSIKTYVDQTLIGQSAAANLISIPIAADLASQVTQDRQMDICFEFPDAKSPSELHQSSDTRKLGYLFTDLEVNQIVSYPLPVEFSFKKDQTQALLLNGFSLPENIGTWTDGNEASLTLPLKPDSQNLNIKFAAMPFIVKDKVEKQTVIIKVNGNVIREMVLTQVGEFSIPVPNKVLTDDGVIKISFQTPNAVSPYSLSMSDDKRLLGLMFQWIKIEAN